MCRYAHIILPNSQDGRLRPKLRSLPNEPLPPLAHDLQQADGGIERVAVERWEEEVVLPRPVIAKEEEDGEEELVGQVIDGRGGRGAIDPFLVSGMEPLL